MVSSPHSSSSQHANIFRLVALQEPHHSIARLGARSVRRGDPRITRPATATSAPSCSGAASTLCGREWIDCGCGQTDAAGTTCQEACCRWEETDAATSTRSRQRGQSGQYGNTELEQWREWREQWTEHAQ